MAGPKPFRIALALVALTCLAGSAAAQDEPAKPGEPIESEPQSGTEPPSDGTTMPVAAEQPQPVEPAPKIVEPTKDADAYEAAPPDPIAERDANVQDAGAIAPAQEPFSIRFGMPSEDVLKALGGVGSTALGVWGLVKARKRQKALARLIDRVEKAYRVERDDPKARGELERLRDEFKASLARAELDEKHFILLDDRIRDRQVGLGRAR